MYFDLVDCDTKGLFMLRTVLVGKHIEFKRVPTRERRTDSVTIRIIRNFVEIFLEHLSDRLLHRGEARIYQREEGYEPTTACI